MCLPATATLPAVWNDVLDQEGKHSCFLFLPTPTTWDDASAAAAALAPGVHLLTSKLVRLTRANLLGCGAWVSVWV